MEGGDIDTMKKSTLEELQEMDVRSKNILLSSIIGFAKEVKEKGECIQPDIILGYYEVYKGDK